MRHPRRPAPQTAPEPRPYAHARIREIPLGVQGFIAFTLANADRVFAYEATAPGVPHYVIWIHIAVILSPFLIARITPILAITPRLFLRDAAEISVDTRGIFYRYDGVKHPLFVPWEDCAKFRRTRWGLVFETRPRAELTAGMPKFQSEFWRGKTRHPIRLPYVQDFEPQKGLRLSLAAARRAGVEVEGFATTPARGAVTEAPNAARDQSAS